MAVLHEFARGGGDFVPRASGDPFLVDECTAGAYARAAGLDVIRHVGGRDAADGEEGDMLERRKDVLDVGRPDGANGEHLHEMRARLVGGEDFGGGKGTGHSDETGVHAGPDDVDVDGGSDHEGASRVNRHLELFARKDGAGAHEHVGAGRADGANGLCGLVEIAGLVEGDLDQADAAGAVGFCELGADFRGHAADDRDDPCSFHALNDLL